MSILTSDIDLQLDCALDAMAHGDANAAIAQVESIAHLDIPRVDAVLGMLLVNSGATPEERDRGLILLRRAARRGDESASHNLQVALLGLASVEADSARKSLLLREAEAWAAEFAWTSYSSTRGRVLRVAQVRESGEVEYDVEVEGKPGYVLASPAGLVAGGSFGFFERSAALRAATQYIAANTDRHIESLAMAARLRRAARRSLLSTACGANDVRVSSVRKNDQGVVVILTGGEVKVSVTISQAGIAHLTCDDWQLLTPIVRHAALCLAVTHICDHSQEFEDAVDLNLVRLFWLDD